MKKKKKTGLGKWVPVICISHFWLVNQFLVNLVSMKRFSSIVSLSKPTQLRVRLWMEAHQHHWLGMLSLKWLWISSATYGSAIYGTVGSEGTCVKHSQVAIAQD